MIFGFKRHAVQIDFSFVLHLLNDTSMTFMPYNLFSSLKGDFDLEKLVSVAAADYCVSKKSFIRLQLCNLERQ